MKTNRGVIIGVAAAFACVFYALTQQGKSQTPSPSAVGAPEDPPMVLFYVDDKTKEVVGSNRGHTKDQLASLNTPEQISLRKKSALSLLNPAEYERQFPKTVAQIAQEIEAAYAITHPADNFARAQRSKTPEQVKQEQEAISQFLNPQPRRR